MHRLILLAAEADGGWIKSTVDSVAYAIDKFGWPGAIIVAALIGLIWYARTYGPDHKKEIQARGELIGLMIQHVPKQTETLGTLSELVKEGRTKDSDVIREVAGARSDIDNLAAAIVTHGCPDSREVLAARLAPHVDRVKQRELEAAKHRPEAPPGFIESVQ